MKRPIDKMDAALLEKMRASKELRQAVDWLAQRMNYYDFLWAVDGRIAVKIDGGNQTMTRNHVKSILRRDFIEANGHMRGIAKIIDDLISCAQRFAADNRDLSRAENIERKMVT